jgi:hypothetical protein
MSTPVAPLFRETQRFGQRWLWLLLACVTIPAIGLVLWGVYAQLVQGEPWGNRPASNASLLVSAVVTILIPSAVVVLIRWANLITEVRADGLFLRYVPFHWSDQRIALEQVEKIESVVYSPLRQYGGWGIRYGRTGKAYNVSGNRGVLLTYTSGKTLLIGSQQPDQLRTAILRLNQVRAG